MLINEKKVNIHTSLFIFTTIYSSKFLADTTYDGASGRASQKGTYFILDFVYNSTVILYSIVG
jgi:hypothetical protein